MIISFSQYSTHVIPFRHISRRCFLLAIKIHIWDHGMGVFTLRAQGYWEDWCCNLHIRDIMRYFREILVRNLIHGIVGIYHVDPYSSQKNQGFQLFDFLGGWLSGEAPHKSPNVHRVVCVNFASSSTGDLTMFVCMGLSPIATNPHSSSWILHIAMQILITSHFVYNHTQSFATKQPQTCSMAEL